MTELVEFARMNGLGNKILVVDMRGRTDKVTPQAAIALNADPATQFDQIMAIHDPKAQGTDAWIDILNSDGTMAQACGNGTRCVVQALSAETGRKIFTFQTVAGILNAVEHEDGTISVDMGKPVFEWDRIPLAEEFSIPAASSCRSARSMRQSCIRHPPCRWAIRMRFSGSTAIR